MVVAVPPKAELEPGFSHWFGKLATFCKEVGLSLIYYASPATINELQDQKKQARSLTIDFKKFNDWDDFLILSRDLKPNDLFVIISSRKGHVSHHPFLNKVPQHLSKYFTANSFLIVYPKQLEHGVNMEDIEHVDGSLIETLSGNMGRLSKAAAYLKRFLSRK
jgi:hypothetical protein